MCELLWSGTVKNVGRRKELGMGNWRAEVGPKCGDVQGDPYALPAVAVRNTSSMWKFSRRSWEMMIDGEATPAAERAAPKRRPEVAVERVWEVILQVIVVFSRLKEKKVFRRVGRMYSVQRKEGSGSGTFAIQGLDCVPDGGNRSPAVGRLGDMVAMYIMKIAYLQSY